MSKVHKIPQLTNMIRVLKFQIKIKYLIMQTPKNVTNLDVER